MLKYTKNDNIYLMVEKMQKAHKEEMQAAGYDEWIKQMEMEYEKFQKEVEVLNQRFHRRMKISCEIIEEE
jgi:asparagine synthetase A